MKIFGLHTLLFFTLVGCNASPSQRCKTSCKREGACVQSLQDSERKFSVDECVTICTAIEKEPHSKQHVDDHISCVNKAVDCDAVLNCNP